MVTEIVQEKEYIGLIISRGGRNEEEEIDNYIN